MVPGGGKRQSRLATFRLAVGRALARVSRTVRFFQAIKTLDQ
jgi:hypothetical protein